MGIDITRIRKHGRQLRKMIRKIENNSPPDRIHKLRLRTREMENVLTSLALDSRDGERRLLKFLKRVRRRAGKVRDMDVLVALAARSYTQGEEQCSVRLIEYLGSERVRSMHKLRKATCRRSRKIEKRIKHCTRVVQKKVGSDGRGANALRSQAAVSIMQVQEEMRDWPALNRHNLHPFRLAVKKLRSLLQMADSRDDVFVNALGAVKDAIGEWHDWAELEQIGKEVLGHSGCRVLRRIHARAERKFEEALGKANIMRGRFLRTGRPGSDSRNRNKTGPARSVVQAAGILAA
jgi:CHAD domain-containing protein